MKKIVGMVLASACMFNANAAEVKIINDSDGILNKPVFVVEGFDPLNQYSADYYAQEYASLINQVTNSGRDVVIVSFDDGAAAIENNAAELKNVINSTNAIKQGNHPNAVIGISMGGLVARWALKDMEDLGTEHETSVYISYDSPQRGANMLQDIPKRINKYIDYIDSISFGYTPSSLKDAQKAYKSPAASQMLVHGSLAKGFYKALEAKGYPNDLTRVSFVNGSRYGQSYGLTQRLEAMYYKLKIVIRNFRHTISYKGVENCDFPCDVLKNHFYDNVAGSYAPENTLNIFKDGMYVADRKNGIDFDLYRENIKNHSFIPSYSAADIRNFDISKPISDDMIYRHSPFDKVVFNSGSNLPHNFINGFGILNVLNQYHQAGTSLPSRVHKVTPLKDISGVQANRVMSPGLNVVSWPSVAGATHYEVFYSGGYNPNVTTTGNGVTVNVNINTKVYVRACNAEVCSYPDETTATYSSTEYIF